MGSFIQGFTRGRQLRQQQEQLQRQQEMDKLLMEQKKIELAEAKLQAKIRPFLQQIEFAKAGLLPSPTTETPTGAAVPPEAGVARAGQFPQALPQALPQFQGQQVIGAPGFSVPSARVGAGLERGATIPRPEEAGGGELDLHQLLRQQAQRAVQQRKILSEEKLGEFRQQKAIEAQFRPPQVQLGKPGDVPIIGGRPQPPIPGERVDISPTPYKDWRRQNPTAPVDNWLRLQQKFRKGATGAAGGGDAMVEAVMNNPQLWDNLTPTVKTRIAPELAKRGFTGFGTKLSDSAISKMAETRSAMASLKDLRDVLKANEAFIGPVSGLQALNPYSRARQAQADIDRVRQRVGKALEGGVLRKEDEDKYKKILATLTDVPATAIYKVDQLVNSLDQDLNIFMEEQQKAGRRVSGTSVSTGRKVGDIVMYQGKPHRINSIKPDGSLGLVPQ